MLNIIDLFIRNSYYSWHAPYLVHGCVAQYYLCTTYSTPEIGSGTGLASGANYSISWCFNSTVFIELIS